MTGPNFSFDVNLGQLLVTGAITALGWGLRKSYTFCVREVGEIKAFVARVNENDELLEATTAVVDDHTRVLIKGGILDGPVVRLQRRRRQTDPAVFTKDHLS